jgi:hypothetical protein
MRETPGTSHVGSLARIFDMPPRRKATAPFDFDLDNHYSFNQTVLPFDGY